MTLDNNKTATTGTADTLVSDSTKLAPEVLKMVQNMPGGVEGLVRQFKDRGLANVGSSLIARGGVKTITPAQLVQGLGMEKIETLATASGLDVKVVRKELVTVLPTVLEQLVPIERTVEGRTAPGR
ncbi:MAG TPA: YidB family protein [Gemmatimonadaceae bacterium]